MKYILKLLTWVVVPIQFLSSFTKQHITEDYIRSRSFIERNSEYWLTFVVGLTLFIGFDWIGKLLNWSTYPLGIYQKIPFAVVSVSAFIVTSLFLLKALFPNMRKFIDKDNTETFNKLELWQKFAFSLVVFSLLFWGMVKIASGL
jgi:hypothetical protein